MAEYTLVIKKHKRVLKVEKKEFDSKKELNDTYRQLKNKYKAKEDSAQEIKMGLMGANGLFKVANGLCKHDHKVDLEYTAITGVENSSCNKKAPRNKY